MSYDTQELFPAAALDTAIINTEELSEEDIVPERADHLASILAEEILDRFDPSKPAQERVVQRLRDALVAGFYQIAAQAGDTDRDLSDDLEIENAVSGDKVAKSKTAVWQGVMRFFDLYELPYTVHHQGADVRLGINELQLKQVLSDVLIKYMGWDTASGGEEADDTTFKVEDDTYDDDGFDGDVEEEEGLENF